MTGGAGGPHGWRYRRPDENRDRLRGMGHAVRRRGRGRDLSHPHLVLQLSSHRRGVLAHAVRGRGDDARHRRRSRRGRPGDGQPAHPAGTRVARHCPARSAGRAVRLRDELPSDGGASDRARMGPRSRHPRSGHDRHYGPRFPLGGRGAGSAVSDQQHEGLQRLERRVEVLEQMVRQLLAAGAAPERITTAAPPASLSRRPLSTPYPAPEPYRDSPAPAPAPDLEQWFGQRGLLIVGVLALLAAAGFFLKYAIERGWIAPVVRSLLAIAAGVCLAAWGESRIRGGLRRYGAAMIGAGGGLAYLGVWAAAGPYGLVERRIGVVLLAGCTVVVTLLALRHEIEGRAIWALAGAYLAPILLAPLRPNPEAFLGYLEVIGLGTGLLAYTLTWRRTFDLALAGYFLLAAGVAGAALTSALGCWFLAAGALLTLHVPGRPAWPEARVGMLLLAWILLSVALSGVRDRPAPQLGLALLAVPCLFGVALWSRPSDAATFTDPWALSLYGYIAGTALAARRWGAGWMDPSTARWTARGGELLWVLCAAAVFAGGSIELPRHFGRRAPLAGDLALSVFWLVYAAALVRIGFQRDRKDVRSAGLAVAAGAGLKIVLYDLANLEALYRIASFFALALIALAVAYAYNRRATTSSRNV